MQLNLDGEYKNFHMEQWLHDNLNDVDATAYLKAIQSRTAPADVLAKIDIFEKVMLTLVVK